MRVHPIWMNGKHAHLYKPACMLYERARSNLAERLIFKTFRRKIGPRTSLIILIIFLILLWQLVWFVWYAPSEEMPRSSWIDEDINSPDCTNANLLVQYAHAGYKPVHKVTRLPTQLYKAGYCVRYNHWKIDSKYLNQEPVDIPILFAVHSTPEYFKYINEQIKTWDGLISVVLVIPYDLSNSEMDFFRMQVILEGLDRLKALDNYDRVALHLLFQVYGSDSNNCPDLIYNEPDSSTLWDRSYAELMLRDFQRLCSSHDLYPINIARNIARMAVKTPLFISGDIENIFAWNYEQRMRLFAYDYLVKENRTKEVLVHRRFEVDKREAVPRTLSALKMLYARRRAVVFHKFVFGIGHEIPSLASWLLLGKDDPGPTSVFRTLPYYNEFWEPQYVARNDASFPLHDENFPFRFRSNTHLANELCRAGFNFSVVRDLFTVHRGIKFKEKKQFAQFLKRAADSGQLKEIANEFMDRLDRMYPETLNSCPKQFRNFHWSRNYNAPLTPLMPQKV
ncbi:N-acetyllactosaminide beta-1,3-N-acetylglucosaminyltransferase [Aphelenchoides bicaudatus]|nr:N-acetyllactosaminide beta-1,3-N-acetylglucosaminyltransferase [Aphelenchoides bicaudatus]